MLPDQTPDPAGPHIAMRATGCSANPSLSTRASIIGRRWCRSRARCARTRRIGAMGATSKLLPGS
jgi:hypothetical protein